MFFLHMNWNLMKTKITCSLQLVPRSLQPPVVRRSRQLCSWKRQRVFSIWLFDGAVCVSVGECVSFVWIDGCNASGSIKFFDARFADVYLPFICDSSERGGGRGGDGDCSGGAQGMQGLIIVVGRTREAKVTMARELLILMLVLTGHIVFCNYLTLNRCSREGFGCPRQLKGDVTRGDIC